MLQKLMLALVIALPLAASAAQNDAKTAVAAPAVQWSHSGNYIYRKQAWRVTFDMEQQAALQKSSSFISSQLNNLAKTNAIDPDGDLQAISASVDTLNSKLDQLVGAAGKLYGQAASYGISRYDALPSAIILFGGIEYDKYVLKFVTGGGSVMMGLVLMPVSVERTNVLTKEVVNYTEWQSSMILIPTANAGAGLTASGASNGTNKRFGAGLVWGSLNSPSELVGVTYGPSSTLSIGEGLNVKVLALKNFSKEGAMNNVILLAGVEQGTLAAETHLNVGGIFDASAFLKGVVNTGSGVVQWVTGSRE